MRILLSNDDGIHAHGIRSLCEALSDTAEVYVVAPNQERSASSHGISLHRALEVHEIEVPGATKAYETSGTPVDCVKWALAVLHPKTPFDLMLSGVNAGANLATDVLYSGTVAAAGEASLQGVKAMALSLVGPPFNFYPAVQALKSMLPDLYALSLPPDTFLSVNFPEKPDVEKVRWTTLGVRKYHDTFRLELDESGEQVYRYGGDIVDERGDGETDVEAIYDGYISITPLRYHFVNEEYYEKMKSIKR
ncbi:5'/3'-nucleotidase SurE [Alicyclobacillus fastidiosus]|uniref:5'-nucleotidase SurE n=1 Tax=Alicyclobacillus fastidiosus TaxID=392011 RepID=A0ABV5AAR8_9BACL|nr:5'/3'-nucleotidase SurE [Alicyclobacillus fastidiosus]WEH11876.1 5'/3'-nucleotidase SurE [Alicyclobacillus fastidiosus]